MLKEELDKYSKGLYDRVDKTDPTLTQAIIYFSACILIRNGGTSTNSGTIAEEEIDGMRVRYEPSKQASQIKTPIPTDKCEMALNSIKNWLITNKKLIQSRYFAMATSPRDQIFKNTYDKYNNNPRRY